MSFVSRISIFQRRTIRLVIGVAAVLGVLQSTACVSPSWYGQAVRGHFSLMSNRQDVDTLLAGADTDPELARYLRAAVEVREFAASRLGLPYNGSYTSLVRSGGEAVTWNVVAAPEFSLQPRQWCFLVAGCVPYRGYFSREAAEIFAGGLAQKGFDVTVAPAVAYSTLGWFDDPLVDTMFQSGETGLAAIIIHELAHQKLFVRGDAAFSEAYASFVASAGVRAWLEAGGNSEALAEWHRLEHAGRQFNDLLLQSRQRLEALYASDRSEQEMREQKTQALESLQRRYAALVENEWGGQSWFSRWFHRGLSNAGLALLQDYQGGVCAFAGLYHSAGRDMQRFHALAAEIAAGSDEARNQWLGACSSIASPPDL